MFVSPDKSALLLLRNFHSKQRPIVLFVIPFRLQFYSQKKSCFRTYFNSLKSIIVVLFLFPLTTITLLVCRRVKCRLYFGRVTILYLCPGRWRQFVCVAKMFSTDFAKFHRFIMLRVSLPWHSYVFCIVFCILCPCSYLYAIGVDRILKNGGGQKWTSV